MRLQKLNQKERRIIKEAIKLIENDEVDYICSTLDLLSIRQYSETPQWLKKQLFKLYQKPNDYSTWFSTTRKGKQNRLLCLEFMLEFFS